ncbi:MAG: hypothetical protein ACI9TH_003805 [Kiritimatiellia bacterium]|jgi:hypothetical protein
MALKSIDLGNASGKLTQKMVQLLEESEERISAFQEGIGEQASPLFEPADYAEVADALMWIRETQQPGPRFGEWGCGFGVVTGLAALMGFEAVGIERDALLLDQARTLYQACGVNAQLAQANFFELSEAEDRSIGPATFDVIYAYPWPREADAWIQSFDETARPGALLLTFHDFGELRLHRKLDA